jgi:hypothetical protein
LFPDATPTPDATPNIPELNPANTEITLGKRRVGDPRLPVVRLYGRLKTFDGQPFADTTVRLFADNTEVGETSTDETGRYEFFVRVAIPSGQKVSVHIETGDGLVQSNALWLQKTTPRSLNTRRR